MGKRLFEQGGDVNPSLDMRLASGKVGTPTVNHTWQTVVSWLEAGLNFLKKSENLNDLPDKVLARDNLDVLSSGEIITLLGDKADADNVLALDNTDAYTPATSYNPATKAYVDSGGITSGLQSCTFSSSVIDTGASDVKAVRVGGFIYVTGYLKLNSDPTASPIAFILPASVGRPLYDGYIVATDGEGASSQSTVMGLFANNANVVFLPNEWSAQLMYFSAFFPVKL